MLLFQYVLLCGSVIRNFQKVTTKKTPLETLKRDIRDLSDQISDMQEDLNILDMYDTGAFG